MLVEYLNFKLFHCAFPSHIHDNISLHNCKDKHT